jgi:hypothetical protein
MDPNTEFFRNHLGCMQDYIFIQTVVDALLIPPPDMPLSGGDPLSPLNLKRDQRDTLMRSLVEIVGLGWVGPLALPRPLYQ